MYGFTYGGVHSNTYNLITRSVNRPILPQLRKCELVIPGRNGTIEFFNNTFEKRNIEVELKYIGTSFENLRSNANSIATWLETKTASKTLIFDDESAKWYNARIYNSIDLSNLFLLGQATVVFECEPFAYSEMDEYNQTYEYDTGLQYDTGLYYENYFEVTCVSEFCMFGIYNYATHTTPVKITITGETLYTQIYHEQSGNTLLIDQATTVGDVIIIDSKEYTVTINGVNAMPYTTIDDDFFKLNLGINGFQVNGMVSGTSILFECDHQWL